MPWPTCSHGQAILAGLLAARVPRYRYGSTDISQEDAVRQRQRQINKGFKTHKTQTAPQWCAGMSTTSTSTRAMVRHNCTWIQSYIIFLIQSTYANGSQINTPGTSPIWTNLGLPPKISHSLYDTVTRGPFKPWTICSVAYLWTFVVSAELSTSGEIFIRDFPYKLFSSVQKAHCVALAPPRSPYRALGMPFAI